MEVVEVGLERVIFVGTTILKALLEQHSDSQKLDWEIEQASVPRRIFLLSPINAAGVRAKMITSEKAKFQLAVQLREQGCLWATYSASSAGFIFGER